MRRERMCRRSLGPELIDMLMRSLGRPEPGPQTKLFARLHWACLVIGVSGLLVRICAHDIACVIVEYIYCLACCASRGIWGWRKLHGCAQERLRNDGASACRHVVTHYVG